MEEKKEPIENMLEEAKAGEPKEEHYSFPWKGFVIVTGIIVALMAACVIVILLNGGFYQW